VPRRFSWENGVGEERVAVEIVGSQLVGSVMGVFDERIGDDETAVTVDTGFIFSGANVEESDGGGEGGGGGGGGEGEGVIGNGGEMDDC
jgi:hypothetical protein